MKSDRRHELQANALALKLLGAPEILRRYGTSILTAVLVVVLVISLVRYRMATAQQRAMRAADDLAVAREEIVEINGPQGLDPSVREEQFRDASGQLDAVMDAAGSNGQVAAAALSARGDLNWSMATMASATTQPAADESPDDYVKAAETAWNQVLSDYPDQEFSVCAARFGLAAAAENRSDWVTAGKYYQAIVDDSKAPPSLQNEAKGLLSSLDRLEMPLRIAEPAAAPIAPAGPPAPPVTTQPSAK